MAYDELWSALWSREATGLPKLGVTVAFLGKGIIPSLLVGVVNVS